MHALTFRNNAVTLLVPKWLRRQMALPRRKPSEVVFRAIADPTRREILSLLRGGRRSVGDIASNFRTSRPAISRHLRLLRSAGLVVARRKGTARICELIAKPLRAAYDGLTDWGRDALGSLVRFELGEKRGVTTVRLTHSGLTTESSRAHHQGWPQVLAWLQAYVEN